MVPNKLNYYKSILDTKHTFFILYIYIYIKIYTFIKSKRKILFWPFGDFYFFKYKDQCHWLLLIRFVFLNN